MHREAAIGRGVIDRPIPEFRPLDSQRRDGVLP